MKEYQFIKELGKGGQGKVYLAKKLPAGILCAVKCIPKRSAKSCMLALREAELLKKLNHPAFPKIIDILEEDHEIRIVMEYVQGATLKRWALEERISVLQIERVFEELCEAIEYLHDQNPPIIFRDLKPENIMIWNLTVLTEFFQDILGLYQHMHLMTVVLPVLDRIFV